MVLTRLQRDVCRLLAETRVASGEGCVADGASLNEMLSAERISRDADLFHDSDGALAASWRADHALLESHGFEVLVVRERPTLVEAEVGQGSDRVRVEWARDSAFRFFPLQSHPDFGLTLHPFDLVTNKVLALVGRLEVRDWVDVIASNDRLQPLGYLAWAACAKDPAFGPATILEGAARSGHYSAEEVGQLSYSSNPPDPAELGRAWRRILEQAGRAVTLLPPDEVGTCVLDLSGGFYRGSPADLEGALRAGRVIFHRGRLRGALPQVRG